MLGEQAVRSSRSPIVNKAVFRCTSGANVCDGTGRRGGKGVRGSCVGEHMDDTPTDVLKEYALTEGFFDARVGVLLVVKL